MKFLLSVILISNCLSLNWAYPCGVQDILEPSHLLSYLYSKHHIQQPKSDDPSIVCSMSEIPVAKVEMSDLSISSLKYLYLMTEDIQRAYAHGLCLQLLSKYAHPPNYIFVSANLDTDAGCPLSEHHSGTLSPRLYDNSNYLSNVNSFGFLTFNKANIFIETKVTAMKLQGFNL